MEKESRRRIIIIAAHPDDEACGCASVLLNEQEKKEVHVVYLTKGENRKSAFYAKAAERRKEARKAMRIGGAKSLIFMDYPELGITSKAEFDNAREELEIIFSKIRPDEIYVPAYEAGHFDHDVANALCAKAIFGDAKAYEYPMYNQEIGIGSFVARKIRKKIMKKESGFSPPWFLRNSKNRVIRAALSGDAMLKKKRMLESYKSQNRNDILVKSYLFPEEIFRELPNYDYHVLPSRFLLHKLREKRHRMGKILKNDNKDSFYLNISGRNREIFKIITSEKKE